MKTNQIFITKTIFQRTNTTQVLALFYSFVNASLYCAIYQK
jgi:hypothetical protein